MSTLATSNGLTVAQEIFDITEAHNETNEENEPRWGLRRSLVRSVTSRLYVLDFGTLIAEGATAAVLGDEAVRKAYLGST